MILYNATNFNPTDVDPQYNIYDIDYAYDVLVVLKDGVINIDKYVMKDGRPTWYLYADKVMYWTFKKIDLDDDKIIKIEY